MTKQTDDPGSNFDGMHFVVRTFYFLFLVPLFLLLAATVILAWYGVFQYLYQRGFFNWLMTLNGSAPLS